jgi:hypothetical protein
VNVVAFWPNQGPPSVPRSTLWCLEIPGIPNWGGWGLRIPAMAQHPEAHAVNASLILPCGSAGWTVNSRVSKHPYAFLPFFFCPLALHVAIAPPIFAGGRAHPQPPTIAERAAASNFGSPSARPNRTAMEETSTASSGLGNYHLPTCWNLEFGNMECLGTALTRKECTLIIP